VKTQLVEARRIGFKVGVLVALLHFIVSIAVSFYKIWLQTELLRGDVAASDATGMHNTILQVLLFPTNILMGEWLSGDGMPFFWLAVGRTSLLWGLLFGGMVVLIKRAKDQGIR